MVQQTENLLSIRSHFSMQDKLNVFFKSERLLKSTDTRNSFKYLFSDEYIVPVIILKKGLFVYASFLTEPARYKEGSESLVSFLNDVCEYLKNEKNVQWISETPASALFCEAPKGAKAIPFGSHIVNLQEDEDVLWSKMHSKHRNVIKKAEKEGVQIVKGNNDGLLQDYHKIDVETWERSNVKANGVSHLKKLRNAMEDNIVFYLAYKDGAPQAGAIFYYNKVMCYYMHGASSNHSFTGSSNLLHWKAMLDMKNEGVKRYSFVGARINEDEKSKYHGIQRFKERFGGELFVGKRFKVLFNPLMYHIYIMMVSLKVSIKQRRLVIQRDSIDQEWHKWKK